MLASAERDVFPGYDAEIIALHVVGTLRRQGVGQALLSAAVAALLDQECSSVILRTLCGNPIREWYERLQGELIGEKRYFIDDWEIVEFAHGWAELSDLH